MFQRWTSAQLSALALALGLLVGAACAGQAEKEVTPDEKKAKPEENQVKPSLTMGLSFQSYARDVAPDLRRTFVATHFSVPENRPLYGPELAKVFDTFSSTLPEKLVEAATPDVHKMLEGMGCGKVVAKLETMSPWEQNPYFAANCLVDGKTVAEPGLAGNTPLVYLQLATLMEAAARKQGIADELVHQLAVGLVLNPRQYLGDARIIITISLDAIWVNQTHAVELRCNGKSGDKARSCHESLRICAGDPLGGLCAGTSAELTPKGHTPDQFAIAPLGDELEKVILPMRDMMVKLQREPRIDFTIFADDAVPYYVVSRVVFTAAGGLPEQERHVTRFEFPQRHMAQDFDFHRKVVAKAATRPLQSEKRIRTLPPTVIIDRQMVRLKTESGREPEDLLLRPVKTTGCGPDGPRLVHDWPGLNSKLAGLKEGAWKKLGTIHLGGVSESPWGVVADAVRTVSLERAWSAESCGLWRTAVVTKAVRHGNEDHTHDSPVELFPEVVLAVFE